jgi:hypothetical protein
MSLTRGNTELVNVFQGKPINNAALNSFNEGFPLGEAWLRLILRLNIVLTNTTGTTPISEGELNLLKALTFKTSRGETLYNSVPGRVLYRIDEIKSGTPAPKDAISATPGTFRVQYSIWFIDPLLVRPEDFLLNTSRYNRVQMDLLMGDVADLLAVVGDSAITVTADLYAERIRGILNPKVAPVEYTEITIPSPVDPSSQVYADIERASDLAIKRIMIMACDSATLGSPFVGTPSDTTLDKIGFDTDRGELLNKVFWLMLNAQNKQDFRLAASQVGINFINFCRDGSKQSSVSGSGFSRFRVFWDILTLSTSQISLAVEGFRPLK